MATNTPPSDFSSATPLFLPVVDLDEGAFATGTNATNGTVQQAKTGLLVTENKSQLERQQVTIENRESRPRPTPSAPSMLKKQPPNVLPLHLAPIDQFFCDDDTDNYPMASVIHLDFTGQLDAHAFEAALDDALARHVLLRCHIKPAKRNLPGWVRSDLRLPWIDWGPLDEPLKFPGEERIDLSQETGLRFWVRGNEQQTRVTVQVHHACTDGTGVYRFLGDVLAGYAARTAEEPNVDPAFAQVDPLLLRSRRRKMADRGHHDFSIFKFITHGLGQAYNIFGKSVESLHVPPGQIRSTTRYADFPEVHTVTIDKQQHKQLRAVAGGYGATLNDLLMAEMFRTIVRWNDTCGHKSQRNPWLRVMMPFDLRNQADYHMPAANMTSYTFVTRRQLDCVDIKQLMSSVRDETLALKHQRAGTNFIDAIMLAAYAPSILRYLLRRPRCIATTCLSNIGDPSKRFTADLERKAGRIVAGNLTLDAVSGVPPMRQHTHATLAVFSYLRQLTISVRCDPFLFNDEQSLAFVTMYRDGLLAHLAE